MKAVEIVDMYFKDFIKYLETKGIQRERFSMDIWMNKVWEIYYGDFINAQKKQKLQQDTIQLFNSEEIQRMFDQRKLLEIKNQERMNPKPAVEQQESEEHKAEMDAINEEEKISPSEKVDKKKFKLFRRS